MRKLLIVAFLCAQARAQSFVIDLPAKSQKAEVTQRIGMTDITIRYHRPLVNGRTIWGDLVPYGKVWRTGANLNTTITFADPVTVEGTPLDRGTYGLHMLPNPDSWTIIFSKSATSWGSFTYSEKEDAARVTVKTRPSEFHNALTFDFDDVQPSSALVTLKWEKLAVPFRVVVDVHQVAQESIKRQLRTLERYTWMSWNDAAKYLLAENIALDDALTYVNRSIEMEDRPENELTRSKILTALKRPLEIPTDPQHAFDFEIGKWKTHVRRLQHPLTGSTTWSEMDGITMVRKVWNGRGNLVELEADTPAGHFAGLSLRLYNPETKQWSLNYANANDGTLTQPTVGGFKDGRGEFFDDETINGRAVRVRFVITPVNRDEIHFEQAFSTDGGKTWEVNWIATDTRAEE